jgi:hypothetical protein
MRGDACAHGSGAKNDSFLDRTSHGGLFEAVCAKGQVTKPASCGQTARGGVGTELEWC